MNVFRLSMIDECSYCLEQSYLFDVVVMVTPGRIEKECVCVCGHTDLCLG